jgi:hypothetical protein
VAYATVKRHAVPDDRVETWHRNDARLCILFKNYHACAADVDVWIEFHESYLCHEPIFVANII